MPSPQNFTESLLDQSAPDIDPHSYATTSIPCRLPFYKSAPDGLVSLAVLIPTPLISNPLLLRLIPYTKSVRHPPSVIKGIRYQGTKVEILWRIGTGSPHPSLGGSPNRPKSRCLDLASKYLSHPSQPRTLAAHTRIPWYRLGADMTSQADNSPSHINI